jgi:hypothetical protein
MPSNPDQMPLVRLVTTPGPHHCYPILPGGLIQVIGGEPTGCVPFFRKSGLMVLRADYMAVQLHYGHGPKIGHLIEPNHLPTVEWLRRFPLVVYALFIDELKWERMGEMGREADAPSTKDLIDPFAVGKGPNDG